MEIAAARSLHEVAADGRGIAQLRRRAREQRLGDRGIAPGERGVVSELGVADQRADAHAAIGQGFDAIESRSGA